VVGDVTGEDHLDDDLPHVPVLSLAQELKHVILRVEQELESNCAVMVLQDGLVVVA